MSNEVIRRVVTREKLSKISDLSKEKIAGLKDDQLEEFTETLDIAVSTFPIQKEKIENAFAKEDYVEVMKWVRAMRNRFAQIFAESLAKDCEKCLNQNQDTENVKHDRLGSFLDYFLKTATIFYADIQTMLEKLEVTDELLEEEAKVHKLSPAEIQERLAAMDDLNSEKIKNLKDASLEAYFATLNAFVDGIGTQTNGLRSTVIIKNYAQSIKWLGVISEALTHIFADSLVEECKQQIELYEDLGSVRAEKFEIFVNFFLGSITMFVDDIQNLGLPKGEDKEEAAKGGSVDGVVQYGNSAMFSKSILVLYETRMFLETFRVALDGTDYNLAGATTDKGVLEYLRGAKPDLILLDDDIAGVDALKLARSIKKKGLEMPMILLTSNITKEYMVQAVSAGIVDFVIKPIATIKVREKVAHYLE